MNFDDLNARSKKLYVCGARSYGQEATGGHSGLTDDVSFSKKLHNWPIFTFSMFQVTDGDLETYFNQYGTVTSIDQKVSYCINCEIQHPVCVYCVFLDQFQISMDFFRSGPTLARREDMATLSLMTKMQ